MAKEYFVKEGDVDVLKDNVDNKISSPNTAEVGQILSVKAIDGNGKPTEWEVVNKPGSGPGESSPYIYMTQAEYEALTEYEQDRMYWVTYPVSGGHLVWRNGEIISGDGTLNNYSFGGKNYYLLKPRIILTKNLEKGALFKENVTHVDIASTMTEIGEYCFGSSNENVYLKEVNINKSIKSIGNYAFHFCSSLTSINIPDSVTSIGQYAFENCTSLTGITIPDGVTSLAYNVFRQCTSLKSITLPNSVTSISEYALESCRNLANLYYKGTEEQWNAITKGTGWNGNMGADVTGGTVIHYNS